MSSALCSVAHCDAGSALVLAREKDVQGIFFEDDDYILGRHLVLFDALLCEVAEPRADEVELHNIVVIQELEGVKHYKLDVTLCRTAKVPAEMWKDVFQSLSRCQLDACGIVCRTWRNLVEDPSAPARHFEHVAFLPPNVLLVHPSHVSRPVKVEGPHGHYVLMDDGVYDDSPLAFFWNSDEARNRRADAPPQETWTESCVELCQRTDAPQGSRVFRQDDWVELIGLLRDMASQSFIEHFYLGGPMSEQLLQSLSPQFFNEVKVKSIVYGAPGGHADTEDAAMLHRFFFTFKQTPNLVVTSRVNAAFLTDEFMTECIARSVYEIRLPRLKPRVDEDAAAYPLSSDAIFDFCFGGSNRGARRTFNAWGCRVSEDFIDKVVLDSHNPLTQDPVELRFFVARGSPRDQALRTSLQNHRDKLLQC
ncbi:hypothetical protein AAVH_06326, partial [Aphelenchoides avenae]